MYVQAKAQAQLADARLIFRREIEAAAERIASELDGMRVEAPELGLLDGVLDVVEAIGRAVERVVEDIFTIEGPVLDVQTDVCITTPDIVTVVSNDLYEIVADAGLGSGSIERAIEGGKKPGQVSAEQLLAARRALIEGRDRGRKRLREIVEAIRAHEAMRRGEGSAQGDE